MVLTSIMMKDLNHTDPGPNLTVKVIDIDAPGTGRIPCTLIRPYTELQVEPESKRAFERSYEELRHRANMKTGGIAASDKRDFGLDVRFTHRTERFFDAQSNFKMCSSRSWTRMRSSITPFEWPKERCLRLASHTSTESPVLQVQPASPFRACGCSGVIHPQLPGYNSGCNRRSHTPYLSAADRTRL